MNPSKKKTIIFELEFFAVWCAWHIWKENIYGSPTIIFTDNDAVRDSLIGCQTGSESASAILEACLRLEFSIAVNLWIARVPTDSNIADDPSRNVVDTLVQLGASRDLIDDQNLWKLLLESVNGGDKDQQLRPHSLKKKFVGERSQHMS